MLISVEKLSRIWQVAPNGVLHIGAHKAEEAEEYERHNWGYTIWIEAQSDLAEEISKKLDLSKNMVINATIWGESGIKLNFKVSSNSQSSSLLNFGSHQLDYPDVKITSSHEVITRTISEILTDESRFDFVNLDIQGVELQALKGMGQFLNQTKWIYTEVNKKEVYEGCSKISEMDAFLNTVGFKRVATRWVKRQGWGDALYIRTGEIIPARNRMIALIDEWAWLHSQLPSLRRLLVKIRKILAKTLQSFK